MAENFRFDVYPLHPGEREGVRFVELGTHSSTVWTGPRSFSYVVQSCHILYDRVCGQQGGGGKGGRHAVEGTSCTALVDTTTVTIKDSALLYTFTFMFSYLPTDHRDSVTTVDPGSTSFVQTDRRGGGVRSRKGSDS